MVPDIHNPFFNGVVRGVVEGVGSVHFDNGDAIRKAIRHLRAMGHERIGYCGGPESSRSAWERLEEFKQLLGSECEGEYLGAFSPTFEGGQQATDVALNKDVTAVVTYNDLMAVGFIKRMNTYGLTVPGRLSIVGIDDIPVAEIVTPGLTTVSLPRIEAGKAAVELLMSGRTEVLDLPTNLIVRSSTSRREA
ncbi:LacI family transcriptional regulator [Actinomycetaceae bacterium WB03_NA08]|uniref:LacI family transcriptional regulator n=1 Tax=Scrofimicrobium canadense TaxID=2652290 RepID=A0A6N7VNX2_9ACTO|nr:substrate-binding domain-containing protein [Scrofimicrobium canadense]MSS83419.1 LacI family transcriptional regulator [Scrofimicrobium canadense]